MKRSFTLIELLVFMGISAVLVLVLSQILYSSLDVQLESTGASGVSQSADFILSRWQYDLHQARAILTPATPGQTSSALSLNVNGNTYTYSILNNQLLLTTPLGVDLLTDAAISATNFTVTRIGNGNNDDTVRLNITLTSLTSLATGQTQSRVLQTSLSLK